MESPRLSPDGREIAYWMIEANGSTNIWTQAFEGGSPRRVTADAESISYPWWSPDGQWLAVEIKRGKVTHVGVVSKNGGPVEQITNATGLSSRGVVVARRRSDRVRGTARRRLECLGGLAPHARQPAADAFHRAERLRDVPVVVARRPPHRVRARASAAEVSGPCRLP